MKFTVKTRFNTEHAKSGISNGLLWRVLIFGVIPDKPQEFTEHLVSKVKFTRGCFTTSEEIAPGVIKQHVTAETDLYPIFETTDHPAIDDSEGHPVSFITVTVF